MLTTFILKWSLSIITAPFTYLPTMPSLGLNSLATTITGSSYWPNLGWINNYIPVGEAVGLITTLVAIFTVMYLVKAAIWLWNTIKP
jgi:hypothetical protein